MTEPDPPGRCAAPDFSELNACGLNLQAVLELASLPGEVLARLGAQVDVDAWRQLVVVANAGPQLWRTLSGRGLAGDDPLDTFSVAAVERWFSAQSGGARALQVYPGEPWLDLQALGRCAGWHHPSPLKLGIHPRWGTWFGYRVVLLTDTRWPASVAQPSAPPCRSCVARPCIAGCPADALAGGELDLARCIAHRRQAGSSCAATCLARLRCPVGAAQRYDAAQIAHSYAASLQAIARFAGAGGGGGVRSP